jgi:hypothetical protein
MKRRRYFSRKDNLKYTLLMGVVIALLLGLMQLFKAS